MILNGFLQKIKLAGFSCYVHLVKISGQPYFCITIVSVRINPVLPGGEGGGGCPKYLIQNFTLMKEKMK